MAENLSGPSSGRPQLTRAVELGGVWLAARSAQGASPDAAETVLNVRGVLT